jgi:hypothetical protein
VPLGQLGRDLQQAALAGTGIADGHRASAPGQQIAHGAQGVLAAKQPERARYLVHRNIMRHTRIPVPGVTTTSVEGNL